MDPGVTVVIVAAATAFFIWAFRPITLPKILGFVLFIGAVWLIRQVIDFGYNPLEGNVPNVEINKK